MKNSLEGPITQRERLTLFLIMALAAALRLLNLEATPGWYTDEGTHLEIARHLAEGRVQYFAITQSTLLFAKLPMFELILAAAVRLFGVHMGTLRALTGLLGVISTGTLYAAVRGATRDRLLSLLAALLLAVFPRAVLYSRFGFSYNLLSPLLLIMLLALWRYLEQGLLFALSSAAFAIGIGAVSDLWMLVLIPIVIMVCLFRRWQDALIALSICFAPLALYAVFMLVTVPKAFWFDLAFTQGRVGSIAIAYQIQMFADNVAELVSHEPWFMGGVIGLLLIRPARLRWLALSMLLVPLILLGRTVALYSLSAYYLIPLLPLMALGVASLILSLGRMLHQIVSKWLPEKISLIGTSFTCGLLVLLPVSQTVQSVIGGFSTEIDTFLLSASDAHETAAWLNSHVQPDDLVIASPTLGWMLNSRVADYQMAAATAGLATPHLPADLPADRWAFDPGYSRARFLVVDNLWRKWAAVHVPLAAEEFQQMQRWREVARFGEVTIYEHIP